MNPQDLTEQLEQAQLFLDYYVLGATANKSPNEFFGSTHPGIVLRQPAVLDIRPEYAPLPHPLAPAQVNSATDGPEGPGTYTFLDRCSLRITHVIDGGDGQLVVRFIFVTNYPTGFVDAHPSAVSTPSDPFPGEVRLPHSLNEPILIARECLSKLADYLGSDPATNPNFAFRIEILTPAQFAAQEG